MVASNYYVYVHYRLDTDKPFYVGKGTKYRASCRQYRNKYWHNIVNKYGYRIHILQDNLNKIQALNAEKLTIALFKKFYNLVNYTDGGDGGNGLKGENHPLFGKPRTKECKDKISNSLKGKSFAHCRNKLGTIQSLETKEKISKALKGKKKSAEHIKNATIARKQSVLINPIKRSPLSQETKNKISLAQKGKKLTEEHKLALRKPKRKKVI